MKFDEETNQWMITTKLKDSALATTNSTIGYPMGTHYWYFYNDTCYGENNKVRYTILDMIIQDLKWTDYL